MFEFEQPGAIEQYAQILEDLGQKCGTTESIAVNAINYLYNAFGELSGEHNCVLMRFFRTISYSDLTPRLQSLATSLQGHTPSPTSNYLTLLASRGIEPAWNDRFASRGHQLIPLLSEEMITGAPMVAQLIHRLGIDTASIVEPQPSLFLDPKQKKYHVMYVPDAQESAAIVSQKDFVEPYGVRSVLGFGGLLPTGDMFSVLMFFRVFISAEVSQRCRMLASALETSINSLRSDSPQKARLLVAAGTDGDVRLLRLLGEHEVTRTASLEEAVFSLQHKEFDMILCGTNFDNSRMFELLAAVKQGRDQRMKPFICFNQTSSGMGSRTHNSVAAAAYSVGATCYLNSAAMSDDQILATINSYLPKAIWNE